MGAKFYSALVLACCIYGNLFIIIIIFLISDFSS